MRYPAKFFAAVLLALACPLTSAQSTDGFHTLLVFPVVVDSTSFTQSFWFKSLAGQRATIVPTFYPSAGGAPVPCPSFSATSASASVPSLRALCPGLAAGSQFGMLTVAVQWANQPVGYNPRVSGFSRVSNMAGAGFGVEAYPLQTFTTAFASVTGLQRRAASVAGPALQTNCFLGMLPSTADSTKGTTVHLSLRAAGDAPLGNQGLLDLVPGRLERILDVFAGAGAPAGDYENASILVRPDKPYDAGDTGLLAFCTVQDNTSFNADLRMAKSEGGSTYLKGDWEGLADQLASRRTYDSADLALPGQPARKFVLPAGSFQNTHAYYFRHPDIVGCILMNSALFEPFGYYDGVEMRLLDEEGNVIAGGDGVVGFRDLQSGDKLARGRGSNARYFLQVERSGDLSDQEIAYAIICESGSGHTPGDLVRYQVPLDQF